MTEEVIGQDRTRRAQKGRKNTSQLKAIKTMAEKNGSKLSRHLRKVGPRCSVCCQFTLHYAPRDQYVEDTSQEDSEEERAIAESKPTYHFYRSCEWHGTVTVVLNRSPAS
jgi:hypothetical protein